MGSRFQEGYVAIGPIEQTESSAAEKPGRRNIVVGVLLLVSVVINASTLFPRMRVGDSAAALNSLCDEQSEQHAASTAARGAARPIQVMRSLMELPGFAEDAAKFQALVSSAEVFSGSTQDSYYENIYGDLKATMLGYLNSFNSTVFLNSCLLEQDLQQYADASIAAQGAPCKDDAVYCKMNDLCSMKAMTAYADGGVCAALGTKRIVQNVYQSLAKELAGEDSGYYGDGVGLQCMIGVMNCDIFYCQSRQCSACGTLAPTLIEGSILGSIVEGVDTEAGLILEGEGVGEGR